MALIFIVGIWLLSSLADLQLPEIISIILGVLVPLLVQPLKKVLNTRVKRFFGSLLLSALVGGLAYFVVNPAAADLADTIIYVFGFSQIAYKGFWEQLWKEQAKKQ